MGRWMTVGETPKIVCDTGHNPGGFQYIAHQLKHAQCRRLYIVIGFVGDKDVRHILEMLPKDATYHFTQPSVERALPKDNLEAIARQKGLSGQTFPTVKDALLSAKQKAAKDDMIFVGGSTFIVADLLQLLK